MKIVVLGAAGMLGHKMLQTLSRRFPGETTGVVSRRVADYPLAALGVFDGVPFVEGVDATDASSLERALAPLEPDVVVNCVGIVKQRPSAHDAVPAIEVNALLPHRLESMCARWGGRLVHFSTDCVFDGRRGSYTETDPPNAEDLYGRTKALGEVAGPRSLTLRTSIIGRELSHFQSLLEWFLAQGSREVRGFRRAIYSGVTTNHLSTFVADVIARHASLAGVYQVASAPIAKYDLLHLLRDAYATGAAIVPDDVFVCDRSMVGEKLGAAIGYRAPSWPELVAELASDPTPYERVK